MALESQCRLRGIGFSNAGLGAGGWGKVCGQSARWLPVAQESIQFVELVRVGEVVSIRYDLTY